MTPIELRQLLFLFTQPSPPKAQFEQAAKTLVRLGYIEHVVRAEGDPIKVNYSITAKGRSFVELLCDYVTAKSPEPEIKSWWTRTDEREWLTDASDLHGDQECDPYGKQLPPQNLWVPKVEEGETVSWHILTSNPSGEVVKCTILND